MIRMGVIRTNIYLKVIQMSIKGIWITMRSHLMITKSDRDEFPHLPDEKISAIKIIRALTNYTLLKIHEEIKTWGHDRNDVAFWTGKYQYIYNRMFGSIMELINCYKSPPNYLLDSNWVVVQVGDELHLRQLITDAEHDTLLTIATK
jgi:hypothetical protein